MFQNKKQTFLIITAFVSGMAVMGIEISSARLLAPHFGTSVIVWTNVIGMVMACLALGYYMGGKLADRIPTLQFLMCIILVAGVIFLFIPFISTSLSNNIKDAFANNSLLLGLVLPSLLASFLLFGLPLILLGMVSPYLIKLQSSDPMHMGEISGRVFAFSTIGSIIGTFLPTLWLIPSFGTRQTIIIFAASLIIIALIGISLKKHFKAAILVLLIIPIGFATGNKLPPGTLYAADSSYQYITVQEDLKKNRYLMFNEGIGIESLYNAQSILSETFYDYFSPLPGMLRPGHKKVLILGLAGGTIARQLHHFYGSELEIHGVEIDPMVVEVARDFFELDNTGVSVFVADARDFLNQTNETYDLVIVDAFQNELYIPWTLTTKEFWSLVKEKMQPEGILAMNVNTHDSNSDLIQSITNTQAAVFDYVYGIRFHSNHMIIVSDKELNWNSLYLPDPDLNKLAKALLKNFRKVHDASSLILTDDKAPVEFMTGWYIKQ